jgi:hypothetical protein
LIL